MQASCHNCVWATNPEEMLMSPLERQAVCSMHEVTGLAYRHVEQSANHQRSSYIVVPTYSPPPTLKKKI